MTNLTDIQLANLTDTDLANHPASLSEFTMMVEDERLIILACITDRVASLAYGHALLNFRKLRRECCQSQFPEVADAIDHLERAIACHADGMNANDPIWAVGQVAMALEDVDERELDHLRGYRVRKARMRDQRRVQQSA